MAIEELEKLREEVNIEARGKFGAGLAALAEKLKQGKKAEADLGGGLNPSQPPFTEREEKTESAEKMEASGPSESEQTKEKTEQVAAGSSPENLVELNEVVEGPERKGVEVLRTVEIEAALDGARENYVNALLAKDKAGKEEKKLTGIRAKIKEFIVGGFTSYETDKIRVPAREAKISGAQAENVQANDNLLAAQKVLKEALKSYRDAQLSKSKFILQHTINMSPEQVEEKLEKDAKEILLATTMREAAKIDALKSDKQIEQMSKWRQNINESTERFSNWYRGLPLKYKFAVSGALFVAGGGLGIVGLASTATVVSAATAGQFVLRIIGSSMTTAGLEGFLKNWQEKSGKKKIDKAFAGNFLEALKNQNEELDDKLFAMVGGQKSARNKRMVVAGLVGGIVGTGILATAVREAFGWTGAGRGAGRTGAGVEPRPGAIPGAVTQPEMAPTGEIAQPEAVAPQVGVQAPEAVPSGKVPGEITSPPPSPLKGEGVNLDTAQKGDEAGGRLPKGASPEMAPTGRTLVEGAAPGGKGVVPEAARVDAGAKPELAPTGDAELSSTGTGVKAIEALPIGTRGPEGAIIDYFRANPEVAKAKFGWDGKADISKWAGTKAHQLWLASVEGELAKPDVVKKLTEQGFTADAEGYAKAMHRIGKGFVELDMQGNMNLSDGTTFLKPLAGVAEVGDKGLTGPETFVGRGGEEIVVPPDDLSPMPADGRSPEISEADYNKLVEEAKQISKEIRTSAENYQVMTGGGTVAETPPPGAEDLVDQRIRDSVTAVFKPEVLKDATFKAAGKLTLGKILEEVPAEAYEDKYAVSRYWHNFHQTGAKMPNLPGTGWFGDLDYDDFRKYAEMAKFLRENPAVKSAAGLKNMTMEEFFNLYGDRLGK